MGKTYKDNYSSIPSNKSKVRKGKAAIDLKEVAKPFKGDKPSYNEMEVEYYDDDNFEKFKKRR